MKILQRISNSLSLKVIVPILVVVCAAAAAFIMIKTAPTAPRRTPQAVFPTVETAGYTKAPQPIRLSVMGTVIAAREITLESQTSGEVISVSKSFVPGGYFAAGQEILRIDPQDYQLSISEARAEVTEAEYNLKIEQGYQNVAQREWTLLEQTTGQGALGGSSQEAELALRKPHLEKANADLASARAKLRQAQLNLDRTRITAPFAAMVETKSTDIGATASAQEALATLVGTDEFWVEVSVPVDKLDWIRFPSAADATGADATITSGGNGHTTTRQGQVIRLLPSLEDEGRMARVLISVPDPLNLAGRPDQRPLLLGTYVNVSIDAGQIPEAFLLPRTALRENNKLWVLNADGTLDIRTATTVWRSGETVIVTKGLDNGERVVLSTISAPTQGMTLKAYDPKAIARAATKKVTTMDGSHE